MEQPRPMSMPSCNLSRPTLGSICSRTLGLSAGITLSIRRAVIILTKKIKLEVKTAWYQHKTKLSATSSVFFLSLSFTTGNSNFIEKYVVFNSVPLDYSLIKDRPNRVL